MAAACNYSTLQCAILILSGQFVIVPGEQRTTPTPAALCSQGGSLQAATVRQELPAWSALPWSHFETRTGSTAARTQRRQNGKVFNRIRNCCLSCQLAASVTNRHITVNRTSETHAPPSGRDSCQAPTLACAITDTGAQPPPHSQVWVRQPARGCTTDKLSPSPPQPRAGAHTHEAVQQARTKRHAERPASGQYPRRRANSGSADPRRKATPGGNPLQPLALAPHG